MCAKDMFGKLGYKLKHDNCNFIIYEKPIEFIKKQIRIDKQNKCIYSVACVFEDKIEDYLTIYFDELQAINKQCEELGWI